MSSARRLFRLLCRRLHAALLRTRIAQLRMTASQMQCRTPEEALYQARQYAEAAALRCELAALEARR